LRTPSVEVAEDALLSIYGARKFEVGESAMKELLTVITEHAVMVINAMVLLMIFIGTIEVIFNAARSAFSRTATRHEFRDPYLRYLGWLIAGLTFQLAADIIETSIAPNWEELGRLGAVAAIRTFLNYFLERDIAEARERQRKPLEHPPAEGIGH